MNLWRRHSRFLIALALGAVIGAAGWWSRTAAATLLAVTGFFLCYLALTLRLTLTATPADLRHRADEDDEGILLILILAVAAIGTSLWAILQVLAAAPAGNLTTVLSFAAVPLGWAMLHSLVGYRYAHLYYADPEPRLTFPATPEPGPWDFMYFAFGIGMTAQVSDVVVTSTRLRRLVLLHSVASFFYNAVILALAVNAGLVLGGAGS